MMGRTLSLSLEAWPERDRLAWESGIRPGRGLFDQPSVARKWRPESIRHRCNAYSVWLSFLDRHGWLDTHALPASRVTAERLDAWVAEQRARGNRNATIAGRLRGLNGALRVIDPDADVGYIVKPEGLSLRRALPEESRPTDLVDPDVLIERALQLHQQGLDGEGYAEGCTALRDAAIIGVLATIGSRIGEMEAMKLGHNLSRRDGGYHLEIWPEDNKTKRSQRYRLAPLLTPIIDAYLNRARPSLCRGASTAAVWVGTKGRAMPRASIAKVFQRRTNEWFGRARGPHWVRQCITTTNALMSPDAVLDAAIVLGHSPEVALRHYNKANATAALHRHGDRIARLRKKFGGRRKRCPNRSSSRSIH